MYGNYIHVGTLKKVVGRIAHHLFSSAHVSDNTLLYRQAK